MSSRKKIYPNGHIRIPWKAMGELLAEVGSGNLPQCVWELLKSGLCWARKEPEQCCSGTPLYLTQCSLKRPKFIVPFKCKQMSPRMRQLSSFSFLFSDQNTLVLVFIHQTHSVYILAQHLTKWHCPHAYSFIFILTICFRTIIILSVVEIWNP